MKRTTIYLDADLEILLKLEAMGRKQPMAELLREALRSYLLKVPRKAPPGAGAFDSGHVDTAERAEDVLGELGFGKGELNEKYQALRLGFVDAAVMAVAEHLGLGRIGTTDRRHFGSVKGAIPFELLPA